MEELQFSSFFKLGNFELKEIKSFSASGQEYFITGDSKGNLYILKHLDNSSLALYRTFSGHEKGISSICAIKSWKEDEIIITGGSDYHANFWKVKDIIDLEKDIRHFYTFNASANICRIKEVSKGEICLISWDNKTTVLFEDDRKNITLNHGSFSAWDIIKYGNFYLTAEATNSIKIFNCQTGQLIDQYQISEDKFAIRMIFVYNDRIHCISNCGYIYKFSMENDQIRKEGEKQISQNFLYSQIVIENKLFVGGEDKIVFEFNLDEFETIDALPVIGTITGITVGSQTKDVTICSDKSYVTIYSFNSNKKSSESVRESFLNELKTTPLRDLEIESMDADEFPKRVDEETEKVGKLNALQDEGDVIIVVHSNCFNQYVCIGRIKLENKKVTGPDNKKYDLSITICTDDDQILELFLNYDDDPQEVAAKFCQSHHLGDRYIPQIVEFINANVGTRAKKKKVKKSYSGLFEGLSYGVAVMQGRRPYMEDFSSVFELSNGMIVFCIFDGHGGEEVAKYANENIQKVLEENLNSENFLCDSLKKLNEPMVQKFRDTGSTAVIGCYSPSAKTFSAANLGDSRAVILRDVPIQITFDHKAAVSSEKEIIEKNGGTVANGRINGLVNISRFLGDGAVSQFTCHDPYFTVNNVQKGDRIVLGCDGIFDFLSNEDCVRISKSEKTAEGAAVTIRDESFICGSADNLTAIVIEITQ